MSGASWLNEPSSPTHRPPTTVFLDRDGVINRKPPEGDYIERWEQFEFLPGAIEALAALSSAGIRTIVVTNQRGVALGRMAMSDVDGIHRRMQAELADHGAECDAVLVCPHDKDACDCRKPGLGLFLQAQELMPDIEMSRSVLIGDKATDMLAGHAVGCRSFLVGDESALEEILAQHPGLRVEGRASTLFEVVTECIGVAPDR
jgi:D-glycero-D-manno-heptose 1,7-bisphosphate phosphatase